MKTEIQNENVKKLTAENGMVLTNGGEFDQYPIEIYTNINDDSWTEIVKPIQIVKPIHPDAEPLGINAEVQ